MIYAIAGFIAGVFVGVLYAPAKGWVASALKAYAEWRDRT